MGTAFRNMFLAFDGSPMPPTTPTENGAPSYTPTFFTLAAGLSLHEAVDEVKNMKWGCNTDLQKVFELILQRAIELRVEADSMPKRLYILSDMQFDSACNR